MVTRRDILGGAVAAGTLIHTRFGFAKASQPGTAVNLAVPAGACDCHTHIHGDPAKWGRSHFCNPKLLNRENHSDLIFRCWVY